MADLGFKEPNELKSAVEEWAVAVPELQDKACHLESIEVRVSLFSKTTLPFKNLTDNAY